MKLFALVVLTMTAFAANSVLNRIGVATHDMDPLEFAAIRVAAGVAMLWLLVLPRAAPRPQVWVRKRVAGALALTVYMIGFSWAYISLGAGLGALILFGALQVVIFAWAVFEGHGVSTARWLGATIAILGLCVLLWPIGVATVPLGGTLAMVAAAVGWAAYTLLGRAEADALGATASNFLLCLPLTCAAVLFADGGDMTIMGVLTAVVAGAVTSGLGYALWYRVLPELPTTVTGIAQLSVPVIAVAAGVLFLAEPLTLRIVVAGVLVLGGIAVSLIVQR